MSEPQPRSGSPDGAGRRLPGQIDASEARQMDLAVGGQALIEGVMMRSPAYMAMAVRTPDRRIVIRKKTFNSVMRKLQFLNIPVLRGGIHLIESMALGIDALMFSADQATSEDRVDQKKTSFWDTRPDVGHGGLFLRAEHGAVLLPAHPPDRPGGGRGRGQRGLERGGRRLPGGHVRRSTCGRSASCRTWRGSSSTTAPSTRASTPSRTASTLDADGARPFTTLHPRCGTSFLFFVMLISIVVFSFLGRPETIADRLQRLAFVPLIGGLAYEAIKLSGKFAKAWFLKPVILPGLMMQKITTSEPDDDQLTVAMAALRAVLTPEADDFKERTYYDLPETSARRAGSKKEPRLESQRHDPARASTPNWASSCPIPTPSTTRTPTGKLTREHSRVRKQLEIGEKWLDLRQQVADNRELLKTEKDPDMVEMIQEELADAGARPGAGRRRTWKRPCCPTIPTTTATPSWRSAPAPAATRRPCSPRKSPACTCATPRSRAGRPS